MQPQTKTNRTREQQNHFSTQALPTIKNKIKNCHSKIKRTKIRKKKDRSHKEKVIGLLLSSYRLSTFRTS
jgi:hypothetical protein